MRRRKIVVIVASLFLVVCMGFAASAAWFELCIRRPYYDLLAQEQEVLPSLDALNAEVEDQLPPLPPETNFVTRRSTGLDNDTIEREHGRFLMLELSTSLTSEEISAYYQTALNERGWLRNPVWQVSGSEYYYHDTSCIRITPPPPREYLITPEEYSITIWNDFANQPFAPEVPVQLDNFLRSLGIPIEMESCP